MISDEFEMAVGSIVGRDHLRPLAWRNNQDGWAIRAAGDAIAAVVTDGCGSEARSETGAGIGAEIFAQALADEARRPESDAPTRIIRAGEHMLDRLRTVASAMGADLPTVVSAHFLFTINGVLITPDDTTCFAIGDGVLFLNGERIPIGPFEGNAPPYAAYCLLDGLERLPERLAITRVIPTGQVRSILIGTDGVEHLRAAEAEHLPGKAERIGPISQFWEEEHYFGNPDMIRRRLALMQQEHLAIDWQNRTAVRIPGRLPDDTTLITIRHKLNR
ncbi:MAG: protein phosphatase 2C domain-containing protein [bacterium]|nr:protein phosphatase 2C domain-containing protein [bacterium]